ncbi:1-acyl-sn-glycerol-3-phosphate acyltransferase [Klebsiella pneumoniae subsp. pneumoniae]|nr:1-acyl-sn-glycerol-3-phosphate acyltransferase [Klebsiella pneumoniae subsp. pneumoniae]
MLFIFRVIFVVIYCIVVCVLGCLYCCSAHVIQNTLPLSAICLAVYLRYFGLKVELRKPADAESYGNAIYIANHQKQL